MSGGSSAPPPAGNANYAWLQHIVHHLAPFGTAGVVLANGSMSSGQSGEGDIRRAPGRGPTSSTAWWPSPASSSTPPRFPACLWFLARDKSNGRAGNAHLRDRRTEVLFIDARKMGVLVDRTRRELTDAEVRRIANTYHAWRGEKEAGNYDDVPGYCKSASLELIRTHGHVLTPGRYVGAEAVADDGIDFGREDGRADGPATGTDGRVDEAGRADSGEF